MQRHELADSVARERMLNLRTATERSEPTCTLRQYSKVDGRVGESFAEEHLVRRLITAVGGITWTAQ